jgi:signal transduction histidine kinase
MVTAADRLAAGERPVRIEPYGPTELRRLGAAVTSLTLALDARAEERERLAKETAALEERQRLARDLHDSVSQALFGINLSARSGLKHLGNQDAARTRLEQILTLAAAAQAEMRALIFELRPDQLQTDGLVKALELQTFALKQRREFVVEATFCAEPAVSLAVKEAFYRIAQEAVANALRHARPNLLTVELDDGNKALTLKVCDDGRGFDPTASYPGHYGLHSMRERAAEIGATLSIESQKLGGTHVYLTYAT